MPTDGLTAWKVISKTVRGPTHDRLGLPNQDFIKDAQGDLILAAVSDGHGSTKCFRSDVGSRFAAETAIAVVEPFLTGEWAKLSFLETEREVELRLPNRIVGEWRKRVHEHLAGLPITDKERKRLVDQDGEQSLERIDKNPLLVYGATLVTVAISKEFLLYLQLGDGDILTVLESGEVMRPLPQDERLFANETTSLSLETAGMDFRSSIQLTDQGLPLLILIATDGYSNSFKDDDGLFKAGTDFLNILQSDGGAKDIEDHLEEWLFESAQNSGDDVTLGLLYRPGAAATHEHSAFEDAKTLNESASKAEKKSEPKSISKLEGEVHESAPSVKKTDPTALNPIVADVSKDSLKSGDQSPD